MTLERFGYVRTRAQSLTSDPLRLTLITKKISITCQKKETFYGRNIKTHFSPIETPVRHRVANQPDTKVTLVAELRAVLQEGMR